MLRPLLFALLICAALSAYGQGQPGSVPLPPVVRASLERNARLLGPLSVKTKEHHESTMSAAQLGSQLGMDSLSTKRLLDGWEQTFAWQSGGWYFRQDEQRGGTIYSVEHAFDGAIYYIGDPTDYSARGPRQALSRKRVDLLPPEDTLVTSDYLEAAGFAVPQTAGALARHEPIRSLPLYLLDHGGRVVDVRPVRLEDESLIRLEIATPNQHRTDALQVDLDEAERKMRAFGTMSEEDIRHTLDVIRLKQNLPESIQDVFFLDKELSYAVVRRERRYSDGTLLTVVENSEWETVGDRGVWLPRESKLDYYTYESTAPQVNSGEPLLTHVMRTVNRFGSAPIEPSRFTLVYTKPGTRIFDQTMSPNRLTFEVAARPEHLDAALARAKALESAEAEENASAREGSAGASLTGSSPGERTGSAGSRGASGGVMGGAAWAGFAFVNLGIVALIVMWTRRRFR